MPFLPFYNKSKAEAKVSVKGRSSSTFRILDAVSEGEVYGLHTGDGKSVFFDQTPLQSASGSNNFNPANVSYDQRTGTPDQTVIPGFSEVESAYKIDIEVTKANDPGVYIRQNQQTGIDAIRLTMKTPAQYRTGDDDGRHKPITVEYRILTSIDGGDYTVAKNVKQTGSWETPYERSWRIEKPSGANETTRWFIKVQRLTNDFTGATQGGTFVSTITEILDSVETYPDTAIVGVTISAKEMTSIPPTTYLIRGVLCQVPDNYNPTTFDANGEVITYASYTGQWDGASWKTSWTDDPAWILLDLLTNTRYGAGDVIDTTSIDTWSFYQASQYNIELVPFLDDDGITNKNEPRYTFNGIIQKQQDAFNQIQQIAEVMEARIVPVGTTLVCYQDRPSNTVSQFSNADVKDGLFDYSSGEDKDKITVSTVLHNDRKDRWLPHPVTEKGTQDLIDKYGWNVKQIASQGIASEGQARRKAKKVIEDSITSTTTCVFEAGWKAASLEPYDQIEIYDRLFTRSESSGLIVSAVYNSGNNETEITLDREVDLSIGTTWEWQYVSSDAVTINKLTPTNGIGSTSVITVDNDITDTITKNHTWALIGDSTREYYKVLGIQPNVNEGTFKITCIKHDPDKYARIDAGISLDVPTTRPIDSYEVPEIQNLSISHRSSGDKNTAPRMDVTIGWDPLSYDPDGDGVDEPYPHLLGYQVVWDIDGGNSQIVPITAETTYTIENTIDGTYNVSVYAYSTSGRKSIAATAEKTIEFGGVSSNMVPPLDLRVRHKAPGTTQFFDKDLSVEWTPDASYAADLGFVFYDYEIHVLTEDDTLLRTEWTQEEYYVYTYDNNVSDNDGIPNRNIKVKLFARDTEYNISELSTDVVFNNDKPVVPSVNTIDGFEETFVDIVPPVDTPDIAGYYVFRSTTTGFTPSSENQLYKGPDTYHVFQSDVDTTYYYRIAAYDVFDDSIANLNIGPENTVTIVNKVSLNDISFAGITFNPNNPSANRVSWTAATAHYTDSSTTTYNIAAGNTDVWSGGIMYIYWDKLSPTTILNTTNIVTATGGDKRILATYKGGTNLITGNGNAFIDGSNIIAGTVSSGQLVTGNAVITETAQIANAIVSEAKIQDLAVSSAKIQDLAVDTIHLVNGSVTKFKQYDLTPTYSFFGVVIAGDTTDMVTHIVNSQTSQLLINLTLYMPNILDDLHLDETSRVFMDLEYSKNGGSYQQLARRHLYDSGGNISIGSSEDNVILQPSIGGSVSIGSSGQNVIDVGGIGGNLSIGSSGHNTIRVYNRGLGAVVSPNTYIPFVVTMLKSKNDFAPGDTLRFRLKSTADQSDFELGQSTFTVTEFLK